MYIYDVVFAGFFLLLIVALSLWGRSRTMSGHERQQMRTVSIILAAMTIIAVCILVGVMIYTYLLPHAK